MIEECIPYESWQALDLQYYKNHSNHHHFQIPHRLNDHLRHLTHYLVITLDAGIGTIFAAVIVGDEERGSLIVVQQLASSHSEGVALPPIFLYSHQMFFFALQIPSAS